jgi:predicted anti-sigma-YlaC factor YlaD
MDCEGARIAISALLDAEESGVERESLDLHLDGCADCRLWREEAHEITRRFRLVAADVPAPSEDLRDAMAAATRRWSWPVAATRTRLALVLVALGQIVLTVPALIFGSDHDAPIHVAHEMGSFDLALAAGFLVAAWRPSRARGMSTIVGVAALALILTAVIDLTVGRTSPTDEAPHLLAVAGWLLLLRLSAFTLDPIEELSTPVPAWLARRLRRAPREIVEEGVFERDRLIGTEPGNANGAEVEMPRRKTGAMR